MKSKNYYGMSLVEMMIAILIFTLGIAGFSLLFSRSWKYNSYTLEMGQASFSVSQGMTKMVNYIRKARQGDDGSYPIVSANNNDLVLFSDYNSDGITERLHFYYTGGQIRMGIRLPTNTLPKTYPAGDQQTITLVSKIINEANVPIFYYYNKDYPGDQAGNPVATPADISVIRLVKIFLKINVDPNRAPDNIQQQSFVELRNLNDYDRLQ